MKNKKIKYNHVGRPTNEEVNHYKNKRNMKIIGIIVLCIMFVGGLFLFINKDNLSFDLIMGNSAVNSTMKKVQNSSSYTTITFNPYTYKNGYYYQKQGPYNNQNFISYLFSKTGHSDSRYTWNKIQVFYNGKYMTTYNTKSNQFKVSKKYVGKMLALKVFVKSKVTNKNYVKYLRLYITGGNLINQPNTCSFVEKEYKNNNTGFWWPIEIGKNGKPRTTSIRSGYGNRSLNGSSGMHYGIDISGGNSPDIIAAYDGKVVKVVNSSKNTYNLKQSSYGTYVIIEHNYKGEKLYTIYAHMVYNSIPSNIYVGAYVTAGTKLGVMGNTGYSSGTHLHFEMRKNDTKIDTRAKNNVNPLNYVNPSNPYPGGKYICSVK